MRQNQRGNRKIIALIIVALFAVALVSCSATTE